MHTQNRGESLRNTHAADCLEYAPWTPCTESLEGPGMFQEKKPAMHNAGWTDPSLLYTGA